MKYLVTCLLALPLMTACVEQDQYYEQNYYSPPPRVEVHPVAPNRHYHGTTGSYREAHQESVYHGHGEVSRNSVLVNPRAPRAHVENTHGHVGNNGHIARHPNVSGSPVVVPQGASHGHNNNHDKPQQPVHSNNEVPEITHGHH